MPEKKNALAELAEDFDMFLATMNCYVDGKDETMLNKVKRIVAELTKVESLYEKMNAKASDGQIVEAEELAHELHIAKGSMFANCRAIAEEVI